jgi:hypothetical protein
LYEEHEHDEEQYGHYYQDYIEERNSDIRKRLYQRSQPARTSRHSRWEKEMQHTKEATRRASDGDPDHQTTIYETEQQQTHKNKDGKKRKRTTKPNHTTEWIQDPRMADAAYATRRNGGTGGHVPLWLDWATIQFRFFGPAARTTGRFCVFGPVLGSPAHGLISLAMG